MAESLVAQAVARLPSPIQGNAQEILHLSAAGWGTVEIGSRIGMTWREVNEAKRLVGDQLVRVLVEDNGYSMVEAIRLLRVPSHLVLDALDDEERNSL